MRRLAGAVLCLALAGCAAGRTVVTADPVIAGRQYTNEAIRLGPLKLRLALRAQVVSSHFWNPDDPALATDPELIDLTIGLRSTGHSANMVVGGVLAYGADRRQATVGGRVRVAGTADGCTSEALPELIEMGTDYLFNGTVGPEQYTCVTVRFQAPGRQPLDPLALTLNPISFGGELIRVLPIEFAVRTE